MLIPYIVTFCRITIGLVFLLSFLSKVRSLSRFEQAIATFNILPKRLTKFAVPVVLAAELAVVVLIVLGNRFLLFGFALALFLLVVFTIAIMAVLVRNMHAQCN